ncbi:MAG TPA: hypothetical protein VLX91_09895 [Candidatus Acidoferrales bacterium]|nr:hypothetical protein [Candidatus Acidoferrales bacterium]
MIRTLSIPLPLTVIVLLLCASTSQAQITATARVTLTVIPAPGISFASANPVGNTSRLNQANDGGITFCTSSNVAVILNSFGEKKMLDSDHLGHGATKTLTTKELNGLSKVEVIYIGN